MEQPPVRRLADYKTPIYSKRFEYFEEYRKKDRQHQKDIHQAIQSSSKGTIVSPCGTGKTRDQIIAHTAEVIRLFTPGIFVIASHRLSLNQQLLDQVVDVWIRCGISFDVIYVGSYRAELNNYYSKYHNLGYSPKVSDPLVSIDRNEIENFVARSRSNGRHTLIASTYNSFNLLSNIGKINCATFDEAHTTIGKDFSSNILEVKPNLLREYYFTATRKISGEDGGMNDEDFYGKVLIDISPRLMLERGEIVIPRIHDISNKENKTTDSSNTDMLVKNTIEAFTKHQEYVKAESSCPTKISAKLLIACNGIDEMDRIYFDEGLKTFATDSNIQAFAISSNGAYINWNSVSRDTFFKELNNLSDIQDAFIFNVDMLIEGIDLPTITGVMPLRNMSMTKLMQLIGRALRLHPEDRKKLYDGTFDKAIKPSGWLVIPEHFNSIDEHQAMVKMAKIFYSEYGTKDDLMIVNDKFIDHQPDALNSILPIDLYNNENYELKHEKLSLLDEVILQLHDENMMVDRKKYLTSLLS